MALAYFLANRVDGAEALVNAARPDLFDSPPNPVAANDVTNALLAAGILEAKGETDRARSLLDEVDATLAESGSDVPGARFTPVIRALGREDYAAAAAALRTAREAGALSAWWIFLAPAFEADLENLEFATAFLELESEVAEQREAYLADPTLSAL
jgi:hypothetical protein